MLRRGLKMISYNILAAVIFLHLSFVQGQLEKGDLCTLKNGSGGTCELITQCPSAIEGLKKGIYPQQCGFEGKQVVVCCVAASEAKPTTAKPTTPKPTTPKPTTPKPTKPPKPIVTSRTPGEISDKKCLEYTQYVWSVELNPTFLAGAGGIRRNECPFMKQELVAGGDPASPKEFPHMVQFGYEYNGIQWTCGGSLISDLYVLTAAHCLTDRSLGKAKYARMGVVDLEVDDHMQQFEIAQLIPYPKYIETSHYHDIGLVKLNTSAKLNAFVRPACLFTKSSSPWSNVIASGWGKTEFAGDQSNILLRVILELFDHAKCNNTYRQIAGSQRLTEGVKDESMICAGHSTELKDTCQGDSGGPLQVYREGSKNTTCMYDVIGVTSFGKPCGLAVNVPAIYTRVSFYLKWIEDIVWPVS